MPTTLLAEHAWLAIALWVILYCSDYFLTLYGARLRARGLANHIQVEGSYELNPIFVKDVDAQRKVSRRFLLILLTTTVLLTVFWWAYRAQAGLPLVFDFVIGALILLELTVHLRHLNNISQARLAIQPGGMTGTLQYSRWLMLMISAHQLFAFAALFLFLGLLTGLVFFYGGAVACCATGLRHQRDAQKRRARGTPALQQEGPQP